MLHVLPPASRNPWFFDLVRASAERVGVAVATLAARGAVHDDLAQAGIPSTALASPGRLRIALAAARLRRYIRTQRPDIVHAHLLDAVICAVIATAGTGVRVVTTRHEQPHFIELAPIGAAKRFAYRAADAAAHRAVRRAIAPSARVRDELLRLGVDPARVSLIPLGLDLERIRARPGTTSHVELGLGTGPVALVLARLSWEKRVEIVIDAWPDVVAERPDAQLVVAGDGPLRAALMQRAQRTPGIHFVGFRSDVPPLIATADVVVHTSATESTGMVFIEALANARPLVSTPVGIVEERLRDGRECFVVPFNDAAAVSRAILRVFGDPAGAEATALAGQALIERHFALEPMVRAYEELYAAVLAPSDG